MLRKFALLQTPYNLKHRCSPCAHLSSNQYHKVCCFSGGNRLPKLEKMMLVPVHQKHKQQGYGDRAGSCCLLGGCNSFHTGKFQHDSEANSALWLWAPNQKRQRQEGNMALLQPSSTDPRGHCNWPSQKQPWGCSKSHLGGMTQTPASSQILHLSCCIPNHVVRAMLHLKSRLRVFRGVCVWPSYSKPLNKLC